MYMLQEDAKAEDPTRVVLRRRVVALAAMALAVLCLVAGIFLGRLSMGSTATHHHEPPAVDPASLPPILLWRLQLVEHHVVPGYGDVTDEAFGLYYFAWDDPSGLVFSRQENSVGYESWRFPPDIPWNTFWAVVGGIAVTLMNNTAGGKSTCTRLPYRYTTEFWPRDFLTSKCEPEAGRLVQAIPPRFGKGTTSFDGRAGVARRCTLNGGGMAIRPTVWTDPQSGRLLRFDLEEKSAGWNPQTWDILEQVPIDRLEPAFRRIPDVCNL